METIYSEKLLREEPAILSLTDNGDLVIEYLLRPRYIICSNSILECLKNKKPKNYEDQFDKHLKRRFHRG